MRFRTVAVSTLWVALFVSTFMALRAADEKSKAKADDAVPPSPGTIKFTAAPAAVQKTFSAETKNSKIELLGKSDDGAFYMAIVGIGAPTYNYRMAVGKDGKLIEKILEPFRADVKLEDCPAPIQKALRDEVKGAKFESGMKVSAAKQVEFVFEVSIPNGGYQIVFTEEGTLLSRVFLEPDDAGGKGKPESPVKPKK